MKLRKWKPEEKMAIVLEGINFSRGGEIGLVFCQGGNNDKISWFRVVVYLELKAKQWKSEKRI